MFVAVVGVNHKTCPIEIREKVSFIHSRKIEAMKRLKSEGIEEVIIVSTCNRSEVYIYDRQIKKAISKIQYFYRDYFDQPTILKYLFTYEKEEAIRHLYDVAAGLDSIVIGEDQILGQVKDAQADALATGCSGKVLNKIFREAISTAKKIKTTSKISEHALSISHIAVKFLKEKQGTLKDKIGFIIGTGKMNELTLKYLLEEQVAAIYVANRTHTKAISLTERYEGLIPVAYENRYEILKNVDFVVSATASPHIILQKEYMGQLEKPLYIMDIAMPRDIDPTIDELPHVHLYDIDDLKAISKANNIKRQEAVGTAKVLIEGNIAELLIWLENLSVEPVVLGLSEQCNIIRSYTMGQIYKEIELDESDKEVLEKLIDKALKKVIRQPIAQLKKTSDKEKRMAYIEVLEELFDL